MTEYLRPVSIEQVAIALCSWLNGKKRPEPPEQIWAGLTEKQRAAYREQATATLAASEQPAIFHAGIIHSAVNVPYELSDEQMVEATRMDGGVVTTSKEPLAERVAKALCKAEGGIPNGLEPIKLVTRDMLPPDAFNEEGRGCHFFWRRWAGEAKAALSSCHVEELIETLGWYASEEAYGTEGLPGDTVYDRMRRKERVLLDRGKRARTVLTKLMGKPAGGDV